MNLLRLLGVASVAVVLVGCPELAMKGVIKSLASPGNPGSVHVLSGGDRVFKVSWVDPTDKDVASIEIDFSTPFATNQPPAPVSVPLGVQKTRVNVPLNNVWYFITVRAVDKAGNKSPGVTPVDIANFKLPYTAGLKKWQYNYTVPPLPGTENSSYSYVYDGNGNLTQENFFTGYLGPQSSEYDHTYNANGNLIRDDYYPWSGGARQAETSYTTYAYDSNGNLVLQSNFSGTTLTSQNTYEYDGNGNMTRQSYFSTPGTLVGYTTYSYDANGHVITAASTDVLTPANDSSSAYEWDPTTHFISKLTNTQGSTSISEVFSFSAGTLTVSFSSGSSTISFDANGLETGEAELDGTGATTYSSAYQYDITGRQIDSVSYNWVGGTSTASSHQSWTY